MLIACHQHQWSYHRVCQRLHINTSQLEISLWKARLHLAHVQDWPMGPSQSSAECPEYHLARPWPQRFFDQAWETAKERCDQQKHLLQCQSCLNFLNRCRVVYYQVDQRIKSGMKEEDWSDDFKQIIQMSPQSRVFRKSARQQVVQLMSGRDMKWLFWIWFFFLLFKGFYKITG